MSDAGPENDITFFEWVTLIAEERGIERDSVEYAKLIEEKTPLYVFATEEFGPFERRRLAIWDVQKIIQFACDRYEEAREDTLEHIDEDKVNSLPYPPEEIAEFTARYTAGNFLLLAYTLAYEFVADLTREIAQEEGLHTEEKSVSQMKQEEATERLHEEEVIDDDLKKNIEHVVDRRNELAHEIEQRYTLAGFDDVTSETAHVLYAVDGLFYLRFGEHAYIPAVESSD